MTANAPSSPAARILVVEDDPAIAGLLVDYLRAANRFGYGPSSVSNTLGFRCARLP